ncbi:uncharacterized protein [Drosophila bipectinata]|uniref:uncharacterized protein n=1 Tax=Drosophila bipectinata TaxID=42026 RepID=UPI0038B35A4B
MENCNNNLDRKHLLREISVCPSIWDSRLGLGDRRHVMNRDWVKVARAVNSNVDHCKRKWKIMRSTFRNELRRSTFTGAASRWHLFKDMEFMRDAFGPLPFKCPAEDSSVMPILQYPPTASTHTPDLIRSPNRICPNDTLPNSVPQNPTASTHIPDLVHNPNPIFPDKTLPDCVEGVDNVVTVQDEMPGVSKPKPSGSAQNVKIDPNDSDYRFLISLMPFVSTFSDSLRSRFQDIALRLLLQLRKECPKEVEENVPVVIHVLDDDDDDDDEDQQQHQNKDAVEEQPEEECVLEDQLYEQLQEQLQEQLRELNQNPPPSNKNVN